MNQNLDVGGGKRKEGWITIDQNKEADINHDLNIFPYPLKSYSFSQIRVFHSLEHLKEPLQVMEELFRVAKDKCIIHIKVPYWKMDFPIRNLTHRHALHPDCFKNLHLGSIIWEREMKDNCKVNWKFIRDKKIRGKHNKLKIYEYEVLLYADKENI